MSEKIKKIVGDELYSEMLKKGLKPEEFDIIKDNYIPKARFNEIIGKNKANEEKVASYEKQLEETKGLLAGSEEFKTKYDELNNKYIKDIEAKDNQILNNSKQFIVEQKLMSEGGRDTDLIMHDIKLDDLTLDSNNNLIGLDDVVKRLKEKRPNFFVTKEAKSNSGGNDDSGTDDSGTDEDEKWDELLKDM